MVVDGFEWVVVGAGPAGIASIGQLIDANIPLKNIVWIDPAFTVGGFGTAWKYVGSNTIIESFIKFYKAFRAFEFEQNVASLPLSSDIECYPITATNLIANISRCNKAIYADGLVRRDIKIIGLPDNFLCDSQTGVITPGIYGMGISFPETLPYTIGRFSYNFSAIRAFVKYLKRIFSIWLDDKVILNPRPLIASKEHCDALERAILI